MHQNPPDATQAAVAAQAASETVATKSTNEKMVGI